MPNKYPHTYTIPSADDVAVVRSALVSHQESLRSDLKSFIDTSCFQSAFDVLNSMVRIDNLMKDIDSYIEFGDDEEAPF